jgi:tetratricopeptide (TPR) repeat protein
VRNLGTVVAAFVGAASLTTATPVRADDVDQLGGKILELDARVHELTGQLRPPAEPGPEIADRRLIDAQVLYELKNYEAASVILFDVVDKYPNSAAYPEALFDLADSLYLKRDYLSSRRFFEKIVEVGPANPRYQESLQRLIELSLHTGDYTPVDSYITKLEAMPSGKQLPSVPYVKGKYFYFRRQFDRAVAALKTIGPDHIYYFHALYFVGAADVAMGGEHLQDALVTFGTILKTEAKTDSQKRIAELAHMALARIYLDRGQLTNSLDEYSRISTKSALFNDALYESAWVSIKGKDFTKAARALDLLQLNAPDSPLIPEVRLLVGSLHIRQSQYGPATETFTKTRDDYEPIRSQLESELAKTGDASAYFRELIAQHLDKFDTAQILPKDAVKWVKDEPDVVRVATLIGDEGDLRKSLDESDEIVRRVEKAISGPGRVNVFPELAQARTKAVEIAAELTQIKKTLAEREQQLIAPVVGAESGTLKQLDDERAQLEGKLAGLPTSAESIAERQKKARAQFNDLDKICSEAQTVLNGEHAESVATQKFYRDQVEDTLRIDQRNAAREEIDGWMTQLESWQKELDGLRKELDDAGQSVGVDDADMQAAQQLKAQYDDVLKRLHAVGVEVRSRLGSGERTKAEQIESILDRARGVEQGVAAFNGKIDAMLDARLKDIRATLDDEKAHVTGYRGTLGGYAKDSADVGGGVVADNFKQVAQRFYNIVVRADVGIIDVAWALKDAATRETNRLTAERKRELKLLDDEFKEVLKERP